MMEYFDLITYMFVHIGFYFSLYYTPVSCQSQGAQNVYSSCSSQGLQKLASEGYITSPGYPAPYSTGLHCTWKIEVPKESRIKIEFLDVKMDGQRYDSVCHDMLRLLDSKGGEIDRFCGNLEDHPTKVYFINDNKAAVEFRTYQKTRPGRGFKLHFSAVPCPPIPLSKRSILRSAGNTSAVVQCSNGAREPLDCVNGRWQPELNMLGPDCVDIVLNQIIPGVTSANKTAYKVDGEGVAPGKDSDNTAVIVGAVIGCLALFILIGVVVILFLLRKRKFPFRDKEHTIPLARPDIILHPNHIDSASGSYTEPVEVNTIDSRKKVVTGMYYTNRSRDESKKFAGKKGSTKSSHSYDLPYSDNTVDLSKGNGEPFYNLYDSVNSIGSSEFYEMLESPNSDIVKQDGKSEESSGKSPARPTPQPPPLPAPNRPSQPVAKPRTKGKKAQNTLGKPKGPAPKPPGPPIMQQNGGGTIPKPVQEGTMSKPSQVTYVSDEKQGPPQIAPPPIPKVVSPYEDDPKPYACVDIITPGKPVVRTDSSSNLPGNEVPSSSDFQAGKKEEDKT